MMLDIQRQIERLPRAERDYVVLTLIEGCNGAEAAERMGVSYQMVSDLKIAVIRKLRKWNRVA
jgi:DNA-directed RNA polymerase specialized sigma24 family protein